MPIASISPIIESMLSVMPVKYMKVRVMSSDRGTASATMKVVEKRLRKKKRTSTAKQPPSSPDLNISARELVTPSAWLSM